MILLCVETTSTTGSMSLAKLMPTQPASLAKPVPTQPHKAEILATRIWQKKAQHSEVITHELDIAMRTAGLDLSALTHLCVDIGPGSFTGIRVGINFVRTLAYALDIPVRTATSLEVLSFQCLSPGQTAVVAIPAIQNFCYAASVRREPTSLTFLAPVQSIERANLSRLQADTRADQIFSPVDDPSSETLVTLVTSDLKNPNFVAWKDVIPLYVRPSEAEEKLRKGLLKPLP